MKGYYFITDASLSRAGNMSDIRKAVAAGVKFVQYRHKAADMESLCKEARALRKICRDIALLINDRVDVALSVGADGVHLGQGDLSCRAARKLLGRGKIIGVTVRAVEQAIEAVNAGADYVAVGPVFKTGTKTDAGKPVGTELIRKIRKTVSLPLVAIGGIKLDNAREVLDAGADAICAISPVVTKANVKAEIGKFQVLFR